MIDPNAAMTAAGEGAKAISKLEEILQKVFSPKWTKKQADADAYADEKKLQTIRDNPDMEIIYANGQMNARLRTPEALAYRAEQRQLTDSIRQEDNIENILNVAAKELTGIEKASDQSVDDDWIARFFSIAKDISTEDMQFVWGKILAGEINHPSSFSLRTLETIKNLSRNEAKQFEIIMPFVCKRNRAVFICADPVLLKNYGIEYSTIMQLGECGLVNTSGTVQLNLFPDQETTNYIENGSQIMIIKTERGNEEQIGAYPLTTAGIELFGILEHEPNSKFFYDLAVLVLNRIRDNSVSIQIHDITEIVGESINYSTEITSVLSKSGDAP